MKFGAFPTLRRGGRLCPPAAPKARCGCGTPLAGAVRPTASQSISTTSPVYRIRICIASLLVWDMLCTNQTPGKIQEGDFSPLLGRFKGDCKGGAPARIQQSGSCGKRRNNGTDEISRLRGSEGVEVCSDATPPLPFFLSTVNGAFFLMLRKKAGLKRSPRISCADKVSPFG